MLNLKLKKAIAGVLVVGTMVLPCISVSAANTMISVGSGVYVNGIANIVKGGGILPNPTSYMGYLSGSYSQAITGYVSVGVGSGNYTSIWNQKILNAAYPRREGDGSTYKTVINVKIQYNNSTKRTSSSC